MSPSAYRWIGVALALAGAGAAVGAAKAQEPGRIDATDDPVRFSYPTAPTVCGTGDGILIREPDGSSMFISDRRSWIQADGWRAGDPPCSIGDAVVSLDRGESGWRGVTLTVGAEPPDGGTDLDQVTGQAAADFLLNAARVSDPRVARDLIVAAAIAGDAEIWPELLAMARDRSLASRTRKTALHWLGRRAAREAVDGLGGIVRDRTEDDEIREAAVFALSQLPADQAVPLLIDVVRTMDDPRVVNRALFWLAEFDDPRAVALFEEILVGG